ncbi:hypothetical protein CPB83DRAFT_180205 [Crepidotus variabilis]|uniref:F-box domain-containing protein n=1 Tax=Crepidotus variabilis TaxID=179855 RepID=A0A9P6JRM6_9AGAR|nr:hypothetical protein CPB83DRAFT_180205 [Crepidotus variabilis]
MMVLLDMDSPEPTRAQILIDSRISQLEKVLLELKNDRNACAHISRLPSEILAEIFVLAASERHYRGPAHRFNFSFICQEWRNVAISSPAVWSFLADGYSPWSQAILQRSKSSKLRVHVDLSRHNVLSSTSDFLLEVIKKHIPRI